MSKPEQADISALVPAVRRAMRSVAIPRPLLEDAYSAGLIGAWRALSSYDESRNDSLEAFAYIKARFYIQDEIRQKLRQGGTFNGSLASLDALKPEESAPSSALPNPAKTAELLDSYSYFLRCCTPKQAEVYRLKLLGYTSEEIAQRLGVTYSAIYYRLRREVGMEKSEQTCRDCEWTGWVHKGKCRHCCSTHVD